MATLSILVFELLFYFESFHENGHNIMLKSVIIALL